MDLRRFSRIWRNLVHRDRIDRDLHDELTGAFEGLVEEHIQAGIPPDEARRLARLEMGPIGLVKERVRDVKAGASMYDVIRELKFAARSLRRQPALSVAVIVTVGLAVSANAALFTVFDGLLFPPLIYQDPDRLVAIEEVVPGYWPRELKDRIDNTPLLSAVARSAPGEVDLFNEGGAEAAAWGLRPAQVWPELFPTLGVTPLLGTWLTDEHLGAYYPQPVLISEELWRTRFAADPTLVGQLISLPDRRLRDGVPDSTWLVGVLPRGFSVPAGTNVWSLYGPRIDRGRYLLPNYGRLAPGVTLAQVQSAFPEFRFVPFREAIRPRGATALTMLLVATGLLLLVAWVQVAALLFARTAGRAHELGVRLALGASRAALARQFAMEGLLVAIAALALAVFLTPPLTAFVVRLLPLETTAGQIIEANRLTFAFAGVLSGLGIVIVSLVPLEWSRRTSLLELLRGAALGRAHLSAARLRTGLLVGQLAVTATLLYMAALAGQSFRRVMAADFGFEPRDVVAFYLPPTMTYYGPGGVALTELVIREATELHDFLTRLETLPGVRAVGSGARIPFWDIQWLSSPKPLRSTVVADSKPIYMRLTNTTLGYVHALGLRVREGRLPTADRFDNRLGLVNTTLARQLAHYGPVVGQMLQGAGARGTLGYFVRVEGVVDDVVHLRPGEAPVPEVFVLENPARQTLNNGLRAFVLQVDSSRAPLVLGAIQEELLGMYPGQTKAMIRLEDAARRANADFLARSTLLGLIGFLCLPLAVAGIAGALLNSVRQQAREIGIRMALGAEASHIRRQVVMRALVTVGIGLSGGIVGGFAIGRWMSGYLFGVSPLDPLSIGAVTALLVVIAWVSALWPAYRASTIAPAVVLREG